MVSLKESKKLFSALILGLSISLLSGCNEEESASTSEVSSGETPACCCDVPQRGTLFPTSSENKDGECPVNANQGQEPEINPKLPEVK